MTVSRVVRGDQAVSSATADRVRSAIAQTGYRPDPALSALAAYRSRSRKGQNSTLAFLRCETDGYSQTVFTGARLEGERLGYALEVHSLPNSGPAQARLCRQLYHRGVRGLLVGPSRQARDFSQWDWTSFAAISLSPLFHSPALNAVATDYFTGATRAVNHLRKLGAKRIGFVVDRPLEDRTAHRWLGGYQTAIEDQPPLIFSGNVSDPAALRRWRRREQVEALLTIHASAWKALASAKITTVFLNPFECPPEVPCLIYDAQTIGVEGVRLLHHQWLNHEFGLPAEIKIVNLQPMLRLGKSPREAPASVA